MLDAEKTGKRRKRKRILGWLLRREEGIGKFLTRTLRLLFECLEEPKQPKKQPIQRKNVWKKGRRVTMSESGGIKYM